MRVEDLPEAATLADDPPPDRRALFRGGEAGAAARAEFATMLYERGMARALSLAPLDMASDLGAALGRREMRRRAEKPSGRRVARNIALLRPDLDEAARAALVGRWWANAGRAHVEYPAPWRMMDGGRVTVIGAEKAREAEAERGQVCLAMTHLAAWELIGAVLPKLALRAGLFTVWQPEQRPHRNRLTEAIRRRTGFTALAPRPGAAKLVHALAVEGGQNVCLFIDEVRTGDVAFPRFGRDAPPSGNLAVLLKLAARSGAAVLPTQFHRDGPARFTLTVGDPLPLDPCWPRARFIAEGAAMLDAHFDALLRARLDEWFMLSEARL